MNFRFVDSINSIEAKAWDALNSTGEPFLSHRFLSLLESSGSVCLQSGWQVQHVVIEEQGSLVAAMPLYLKYHSYGEYVFDWSWADAYHRHGLDYYPKLLAAIPFTPTSGARLLMAENTSQEKILATLKQALLEKVKKENLSGWHILFPSVEEVDRLKPLDGMQRVACHFQWFNRGFKNFDDFLAGFSSRKRKNVKKERRQVMQQGISLQALTGDAIKDEHWQCLQHCYRSTYAKRSGHGGYLTEDFFKGLAAMAEQVLLVVAYKQESPIACALNFYSGTTLYGRYWGALEEIAGLHFEACYYQGIEFCIANGLQRFDPGVQGEHKISRGFEPVLCYSLHHLADSRFREAVGHFLQEETLGVKDYQRAVKAHSPFKQGDEHE
jgi:predicted N-acyltransferase